MSSAGRLVAGRWVAGILSFAAAIPLMGVREGVAFAVLWNVLMWVIFPRVLGPPG
jgi:hypothetical protein